MRRIPAVRVLLTVVLALPATLAAQSTAPPDLDSYVASSMKTFDVPGMAVAIVKDGKILVAKGYGVRKLGDPTPVDEFTTVRHRLEHQSLHHRRTRHAWSMKASSPGTILSTSAFPDLSCMIPTFRTR